MSAPVIDQERLARLLAPDVHLKQGAGAGANGEIDVCVVQATDWLVGRDGKSDAPPCVDPVIRGFAIRLNDAPRFAEWRDELKPFAARLAGTNQEREMMHRRAYMVADWAVREIGPLALERHFPEHAKALRACAPIVDAETAEAGRKVARAAYAAAYAAANVAAAAANAAANVAADAANAAAYAAANVAYAAANAADAANAAAAAANAANVAAAAANAAANAKRAIWESALAMLDRLCALTEVAP